MSTERTSTKSRTGLVFPVSKTGNEMKLRTTPVRTRKGIQMSRISFHARIAQTALLEYITAELTDIATGVVKAAKPQNSDSQTEERGHRLTLAHLRVAIANDPDFLALFNHMNITISHKLFEDEIGSKKDTKSRIKRLYPTPDQREKERKERKKAEAARRKAENAAA